jgi:hypothetical protein
LREGLSKHLVDLNISDSTFSAALKFLHEVGFRSDSVCGVNI